MFRHLVSQCTRTAWSGGRRGISSVGVAGMGSMGHGLVQLYASSGFAVHATDSSPDNLTKGIDAIAASLRKIGLKKSDSDEAAAAAYVDEVMARISTAPEATDFAADVDLVVEAIIENADIKKNWYKQMGAAVASSDTILASNTSSFSITELADASGIPERVIGLHYFNPVVLMKLCEIVSTESTLPEVTAACREFVIATKKVPVSCKDTPGFIVNRLLVPYLAQAIGMAARGDASVPDIDTAMKLGAGHPMGPLTLSDYIGNDISLFVMRGWIDKFPDDPAFQCSEGVELLEQMVSENKLGKKSGEGFYDWSGGKPEFKG